MSTQIPPIWQGKIQQELVVGTTQISEAFLQQFDGNLNYLNKVLTDITNEYNTYLAGGPIAVQFISESTTSFPTTSPNGKPYFCGFICPSQGGTATAHVKAVLPGILTTWEIGVDTLTASISGNTLNKSGYIHEINGAMLYSL